EVNVPAMPAVFPNAFEAISPYVAKGSMPLSLSTIAPITSATITGTHAWNVAPSPLRRPAVTVRVEIDASDSSAAEFLMIGELILGTPPCRAWRVQFVRVHSAHCCARPRPFAHGTSQGLGRSESTAHQAPDS